MGPNIDHHPIVSFDNHPVSWQEHTARRLAELLSHEQLRRLLGATRYGLQAGRPDAANDKATLARDLVSKLGTELLADGGVRATIGAAAGVRTPERWCRGKKAAQEFVRQVGLPDLLAGHLSIRRPDYEDIEPACILPSLEAFQREVLGRVVHALAEGARAMVEMPTGAGKTRVAVESLHTYLNSLASARGSVLWLTHRDELAEQACACFERVWRSRPGRCALRLRRFWGEYSPVAEGAESIKPGEGATVIVATTMRAREVLSGELGSMTRAMLLRSLRAVVIPGAVPVIGLTATAFRKEYDPIAPAQGTNELCKLFRRELIVPFESDGPGATDPAHRAYVRERLQKEGVLAEPIIQTAHTGHRIRLHDGDDERVIDAELAEATDRPARRRSILAALLPEARKPEARILYFAPTVEDADEMAVLLRAYGVAAEAISGETPLDARRDIVQRFRAGGIKVLCNCEVLSAGFDEPRVTHVVMARPTVSQVLYEQMVGRGLRGAKFGGTRTCIVMDCVDEFVGRRPTLAYEGFRELWQPAKAAQAKTA